MKEEVISAAEGIHFKEKYRLTLLLSEERTRCRQCIRYQYHQSNAISFDRHLRYKRNGHQSKGDDGTAETSFSKAKVDQCYYEECDADRSAHGFRRVDELIGDLHLHNVISIERRLSLVDEQPRAASFIAGVTVARRTRRHRDGGILPTVFISIAFLRSSPKQIIFTVLSMFSPFRRRMVPLVSS